MNMGGHMKDQLERRLEVLKREFEAGQEKLRDLVRQEAALRETMLRISGAMQVLEELLAADAPVAPDNVELLEPARREMRA
jgi:predicted nuclease with TOPRIM domain